MEDAIICPACGFDPYDMIIYAAKQEFPDRNPRDVIEEMYKSGDYDDEADFYVFENHPEYCPNQELLMRHIQMMSEEEAYAYAYNDGHSGSRKNEPYKPNPTTKEGADFKKIYKQRAESADKEFCSNCSQEEEEFIKISNCTDCYDDFCEECFCSDCETCNDDCLCKCVDCGNKDHYMFDLAEGGNACMDCSSRCDDCEKRFLRDEVRGNNIDHKYYCDSCRDDKGSCVICDDLLIDYYNNAGHCEVCDESVCGECSSETEDPQKPGYVGHDVACDECVKEKKLVVTAETFEADWRDLSRDSSGRWMKENEISDENLDAYIDIQPGQSGTFPLPVEKEEPSLNTTNDYITIRDLASMMNKMTGGMLGFAESRNTVLEMLGENDSMERRDSLYFTIEDTIMTMENYNETGYEGDIQVMVDIMRDTGIAPPANFEEKVMARYQFEDKYAAEDKKILKPEVPADYNIQQTFGNNMILSSEDDGPNYTIDDFFGELAKLLTKYGSIETFDSERVKEGLYFSGMMLPHNGANNFFQYDEDFGSGIIE